MQFANPHVCPECQQRINGEARCSTCGLDLTSLAVRQLWQTLLHADELLAQARTISPADSAAVPVGPDLERAPTQPTAQPAAPIRSQSATPSAHIRYPTYPRADRPVAQTPVHTARDWSVGTVVLTLGAFGLIVAGFIFVTKSWDHLSLVGRTLILTAVTVFIGLVALWVTRRALRASAEAVWTVFLALLTLDFFAARHENMAGFGAIDLSWSWAVWGVVLIGFAVLIVFIARPRLHIDLVTAAIGGSIGIAMAGIGVAAVGDDWGLSWRSFVALVATGLLSLATRPANIRVLSIVARVIVGLFFLFAYVVALAELLDNPQPSQLVDERHGLPMLLMVGASVVIAAVVRQVRIPAVALAVVATSALILIPTTDKWHAEGAWVVFAGLAALFAITALRGTSGWVRGLRLGALPTLLGLVVIVITWFGDVTDVAGRAVDGSWAGTWNARLNSQLTAQTDWWWVVLVLAAWLTVVWAVPRWPEFRSVFPEPAWFVAPAAAVALAEAVVVCRVPLWIAVAVLLSAAGALLLAYLRAAKLISGAAGAALASGAALLALSNSGVSSVAWIVAALVLAGLVSVEGPAWLRMGYAATGAILIIGAGTAVVEALDGTLAMSVFVALGVSLALIVAASLILPTHVARLPVEVIAMTGVSIALVWDGSSGELSARWTIAGVVLIGLGSAVASRRWYAWPGMAALVVAYLLLIVNQGFTFVEAYTLPLGAAALGMGLFAIRKQPTESTWNYLGPGIALSMLPSLPQALANPVDLRALVLAIGAIVALAVGVRLGWQAPFVTGVSVAALLVLFNLGPYANAAPRVVLIAVVSAILLAMGITWEDRMRDRRVIVGYVKAMR